jgi:hypothetical protein
MSKEAVTARFPKATTFRHGPLKYEIRRPRANDGPPALVGYVVMSGLCESEDAAWKDAARKMEG